MRDRGDSADQELRICGVFISGDLAAFILGLGGLLKSMMPDHECARLVLQQQPAVVTFGLFGPSTVRSHLSHFRWAGFVMSAGCQLLSLMDLWCVILSRLSVSDLF